MPRGVIYISNWVDRRQRLTRRASTERLYNVLIVKPQTNISPNGVPRRYDALWYVLPLASASAFRSFYLSKDYPQRHITISISLLHFTSTIVLDYPQTTTTKASSLI